MVKRCSSASGLVLWSFIAALVGAEFVLRAAGLLALTSPLPTWSTDVPRIWTPSLGILFKPGVEFRYWMRDGDQTIYDNAQKANEGGFLDRAQPGKDGNDFRILILGDSFVEALQVGMEEKVGRVLERLLSDRISRPVTVMSLAISGT